MRRFLLSLFFFAFSTHIAKAAVIINEISPRTSPEWVELYNSGNEAVDLTGWYFIDKAGGKKDLTSLGAISATSYLVFTGIDSWLNNSGEESLSLYSPSSPDPQDAVSFGETGEGTTIARVPDITGTWYTNQTPTQGSANLNPSPTPSPSPSVTPSPSPTSSSSHTAVAQTPTPSPSPSPSVNPSPIPSPTPSPSPKPSLKPSPITSPSPDLSPFPEGTVAGETLNLSLFTASPAPSPAPSPLPKGLRLRTDRAKNLLITGIGIIIISLSGYFGYRKYLDKGKIGE